MVLKPVRGILITLFIPKMYLSTSKKILILLATIFVILVTYEYSSRFIQQLGDESRTIFLSEYNYGLVNDLKYWQEKEKENDYNVFVDFTFQERVSSIDFVHSSLPESGKNVIANHYDHGNGVLVADVNNDSYIDVYFLNLLGDNYLAINNGDGTFSDGTTDTLKMTDSVSISGAFGDIDNDGDQDLYVTTVHTGNKFFVNENGKFREASMEYKLEYYGHSSGALMFDYNRDGFLDLLLVNIGTFTRPERSSDGYYPGMEDSFTNYLNDEHAESSILFTNVEGKYFIRNEEFKDLSWSGDASLFYHGDDLFPDIYLTNMHGDDTVYINDGSEINSINLFDETPSGSMGVKFFDYDNDQDLDLYVTDMHSDMKGFYDVQFETKKAPPDIETDSGGNVFYENRLNSFTEKSSELNLENLWPWGVSVGDLNADGLEDVFVTASMNYTFKYVPNQMLINNGGNFLRSEFTLGLEGREEYEKVWFTVDCAKEIHYVCEATGVMDGALVKVMGSLGSRSSAIFDIEHDGDLDIVVSEFNSPARVFLSNLSEKKMINSVSVKLEGTESNRDGIGAIVKVYTNNNVYTKVHDGSTGYLSHGNLPLYFGLNNDSIEKIAVYWPTGKTSIITNILDGEVTIRE